MRWERCESKTLGNPLRFLSVAQVKSVPWVSVCVRASLCEYVCFLCCQILFMNIRNKSSSFQASKLHELSAAVKFYGFNHLFKVNVAIPEKDPILPVENFCQRCFFVFLRGGLFSSYGDASRFARISSHFQVVGVSQNRFFSASEWAVLDSKLKVKTMVMSIATLPYPQRPVTKKTSTCTTFAPCSSNRENMLWNSSCRGRQMFFCSFQKNDAQTKI